LLKYVKAIPDAQGKIRFYLRYRGAYQRLPDDPNSPAFYARYSALRAGIKKAGPTPEEGSVASVITAYKNTEEFKNMATRTQRDYGYYLSFYMPVQHLHVSMIERQHVKELMNIKRIFQGGREVALAADRGPIAAHFKVSEWLSEPLGATKTCSGPRAGRP
jgi:hypothetical protein